jgi:hypothetical protein
LSYEGYYEFNGRDQDGWPHFNQTKKIDLNGEQNQERFLIKCLIKYFKDYEAQYSVQN